MVDMSLTSAVFWALKVLCPVDLFPARPALARNLVGHPLPSVVMAPVSAKLTSSQLAVHVALLMKEQMRLKQQLAQVSAKLKVATNHGYPLDRPYI